MEWKELFTPETEDIKRWSLMKNDLLSGGRGADL